MAYESRIVGHGEAAPESLTPHPKNWRKHPQAQRDALAAILAEVGWVEDIVVNQNTGFIVNGHARVALATQNGESAVPVKYVDLTVEEEEKVLVTLDPLSAMAEADHAALEDLLAAVTTEDEALAEMLEALAADAGIESGPLEGLTDPDDVPEPVEAPYVQVGEVYALGEHRLMCGDATSAEDVATLMGEGSVGAVITDPPYNVGKPIANDNLTEREAIAFTEQWCSMLPDAHTLIAFQSPHTIPVLLDAARLAGWRFGRLLWLWKPWAAFGVVPWHGWARKSEVIAVFEQGARWPDWVKYHSDMYEWVWGEGAVEATVLDEGPLHPTLKPVTVLDDLVSHTLGDVYDPFVGSGTTLIASERQGRRCYAMEIEPRYVQVSIERWEAYTGGKAERVE